MRANPYKFQAIAAGKRTHEKSPSFKFGSIDIKCDEVAKLLGIDTDFRLNFDNLIRNICRKASQQLNVLKRIGNCLSRQIVNFSYFYPIQFQFLPTSLKFFSEGNTKRWKKFKNELLDFL